jgi:hypothetical protein
MNPGFGFIEHVDLVVVHGSFYQAARACDDVPREHIAGLASVIQLSSEMFSARHLRQADTSPAAYSTL